jgi:hypothetical protein
MKHHAYFTAQFSPVSPGSDAALQTFLTVYIGVFAVLLFAFESRIKWTEGALQCRAGSCEKTACACVFVWRAKAEVA